MAASLQLLDGCCPATKTVRATEVRQQAAIMLLLQGSGVSTLNRNGRSTPKRSVASLPRAWGCAASQPLSVWPLPATRDGAVGCVPILQSYRIDVVPQLS